MIFYIALILKFPGILEKIELSICGTPLTIEQMTGNPSPWLNLEGRVDDIITFVEDGKEIRIFRSKHFK